MTEDTKLLKPVRVMTGTVEEEREFLHDVHQSGTVLLLWGLCFGLLIFSMFWFVEGITAPDGVHLTGGVQSLRLVGMFALGACAFSAWRWRSFITDHYTPIANVLFFAAIQASVYVAYFGRAQGSVEEVFWALNATTSTAVVIGFGASRLTSLNSLVITLLCSAAALGYASLIPVVNESYIWRLASHLVAINTVCFLLHRHIQRRERALFFSHRLQSRSDARARALEEAKAIAEKADQAKASMLANLSHEIRSPMHSLLQVLERIKMKDVPREVRELAAVGELTGRALLTVFNGILDFTAASAGKLRMEVEPVDVVRLARTVEALHVATARTRGVRLHVACEVPEGVRRVMCSPSRLLEVANNLISNALKFTDAGYVHATFSLVLVGDDKAQFELSVKDSGIGIPKEDLPQVGTPFFQVDQSLSGSRGGTGLGLAMTRQILSSLGGSLEISSEAGKGTQALIRAVLPLAARELKVQMNDPGMFMSTNVVDAAEEELQEAGVLLKGTVLLVEDNQFNQLLALDQLQDIGMRAELADNGSDAVTAFKGRRFDAILMDLQMPGMDGLEATRKIREWEAADATIGHTPIIAWTAYSSAANRDRCLAAGMDDFLPKPFSGQQLETVLRRWLGSRERSRSAR